jgi:hypothetical protein
MTATITQNSNGNVRRKSLASQLDRLDQILDGLDEALAGSITDAVKQAVSTAVAEAVRATLIEVVTNPDILAALRGGITAVASAPGFSPTEPASETVTPPTFAGRTRRFMSSCWRNALAKVRGVTSGIRQRVHNARDGVVATYQGINAIWNLRRAVLIALGIGAAVGVVSSMSSSWFAGVISGVGAMGTALGAQLACWTRRLFAGFAVR